MLKKLLAISLSMLITTFSFVWADEISDEWLNPENWETMSPEEEAFFIAEWDASLAKGLVTGTWPMLWKLQVKPVSKDARFYRIKYNNPKIINRLVNMYIAEYQYGLQSRIRAGKRELKWPNVTMERKQFILSLQAREEASLQRSIKLDGNLIKDLPDEDPDRNSPPEAELMISYGDDLGPLAASTFSPRLYEYFWSYIGGGEGKALLAYFSRVKPEETLNHLFTSTRGKYLGKKVWFDALCRIDTGSTLGNVKDSLEHIDAIIEHTPALGEKYHDEIVEFIQKNGKTYYRESDNSFNKKYERLDYRLRRVALSVLEKIANSNDLAVIRSLGKDILPHDSNAQVEINEKVKAKREKRKITPSLSIAVVAENLERKIINEDEGVSNVEENPI